MIITVKELANSIRVLITAEGGDVEFGIVAGLDDSWEPFDRWPLFSERFDLLLSAEHRLANRGAVEIEELRQERLLTRTYCEHAGEIAELLRSAPNSMSSERMN